MDYSTISNKTTFTEAEELTNGEVSERYYLLKKQFENLTSSYETTKQELHDTRRSYQTALDVQRHLTIDLESLQSEEVKLRNDLNSRIAALQEDILELRNERTETSERHANEIKRLEEEIRRLKEENSNKVDSVPQEQDSSELDEAKLALSAALNDANIAKAALEEVRSEMMSWRMRAEELVGEVGEMRAASDLRREEMRAAGEREAAALADLAEARMLLQQCTDGQDQPHAAKGNSIFAEVEDKRQEMAKNLIQMKQTNSRLRRELANKQSELEALQHEKQTVWEQQVGAAAHYDRELIEAYEQRITQLEGACERQRRELARWFGRMEPAANGWLPGVMDHLKSECERLRAEVLSRGAAELASAAQIRELRRKMALLTAGHKTASPLPTLDNSQSHSQKKNSMEVLKPVDTNIMRPIDVVKTVDGKDRARMTPDDIKKKVSFN